MAYRTLTVAQLRTLVAAIPASVNAAVLLLPDELILPVATNVVETEAGLTCTVVGYLNLANRTFGPNPV